MRKRKTSDSIEEPPDNSDSFDNVSTEKSTGEDKIIINVVKINSVLCLLLGIILGCVLGGPWTNCILEYLRGYKWDHSSRCIMESPNPEGYGVDFCRIPADCSVCQGVDKIDEYHVNDMSIELFQERYAYSSRPLVVRNASIHWKAMDTLDYYWLKDQYLSDPEVLSYEHEDCWFNKYKSTGIRNLASVFRLPESRILLRSGPGWYVGWAVCHAPVAHQLHQLYHRPAFIHPESTPPSKPWIFIGTPGPGANSHIDNVDLSSWQAQIKGVKKWVLTPPPECYWSCGPDMETIVYPGDIIVLNTNYWFHYTEILGDSLSVVIVNEYD